MRRWPYLAIVVLLVGCASTQAGHGARPSKSEKPTGHWDYAIYLCSRTSDPRGNCAEPVTLWQKSDVITDLTTDDTVLEWAYLSEDDELDVARAEHIPGADLLESGDLPAAFIVAVASPSATTKAKLVAEFAKKYGVDTVSACGDRPQCSVATLGELGLPRG